MDAVEVGPLVGGQEEEGTGASRVENPGRFGELVGLARAADAGSVDRAVRAAEEAQREWAAAPTESRTALLTTVADRIDADVERLALVLAREVGTPLAQARGEVAAAAGAFRNAASLAAEVLEDRRPLDGIRVRRRPIGVVAGIVPWNAPLVLAAQKAAPALVTGNAFVLKPSPLAPLAVGLLARIVADALPAGLVASLPGGGDVGTALVDHPLVRKVSFTGGGPTARAIMERAAATLTRVHFELGGNDPAIILDDADLADTAERIALSAFRRSGQVCYAVKRVYVPRSLAGEFVELLERAVDAHVVGDSLDERVTMGPVNNRGQFDLVAGLAADARASGRDVRRLGEQADPASWDRGLFARPSLVVDAGPEDETVRVEQFGPLLPVVAYDGLDEAVRLANATEYGLASSVWSTDEERALDVAERIEAGVTFVNGHVLTAEGQLTIPFGGVKQSGMGWENSAVGLDEYLDHHSIHVQRMPSKQKEGSR